MDKQDLKELRKVIKAKDTVIDWVWSLYVDSENQPVFEDVCKLADLEEAEMFRHMGLFGKTLGTRIGVESFPVGLELQQEELLDLRQSSGADLEDFAAFRDALLDGYVHTDPFYATLARIAYDVPSKSKDGRRLEDGDLVYEALLFMVCPAKLSKPALGLAEDRVAELSRRWMIANPSCGFLYPSFSDRLEDRNEVLIHSKMPETEDFIRRLFQVETPDAAVGAKAQKGLFSELLGQMDVTLPVAAAISENVLEKSAEEDVPLLLEKEDMRKIAASAGADLSAFDEIYDECIGEIPIALPAVADAYVTVKTDTVTLKVPAKSAQLIETRNIDGRDYILIPADGTVTVNGAAVVAGDTVLRP